MASCQIGMTFAFPLPLPYGLVSKSNDARWSSGKRLRGDYTHCDMEDSATELGSLFSVSVLERLDLFTQGLERDGRCRGRFLDGCEGEFHDGEAKQGEGE